MSPRTRERAADALAICASTPGVFTFSQCLGVASHVIRAAQMAWDRAIMTGWTTTSREVYAEAESLLRMGWEP